MTSSATPVADRINSLRQAMHAQHIDAYIVSNADPHLSEYHAAHWQARVWLSGFTGSAGTLVVTADWAGLWTDSRYWSQAEAELNGSGITLMKAAAGGQQAHVVWLADYLRPQQSVAVDGSVLGLLAARQMEETLSQKNIRLRTDIDLLSEVWTDRPPLPAAPVYEHAAPFAAVTRTEKLQAIRNTMRLQGADWHFISTLDDIAYLLNLRGADINFNSFFFAHALLGPQRTTLFVSDGKVPSSLRIQLASDGIDLAPYEQAATALCALPATASLLLDPRRITFGLRQAIAAGVSVIEAINPTQLAKSLKTPAECEQVRATMEQDGAALCECFAWLDSALLDPTQSLTELSIDEFVTAARARRPHFISQSFETIAGFNANAAMPHYCATPSNHAVIQGDGLLLIDSGGQYLGGTTDITRVVPIGRPSSEQKRDFTLVLKGLIALSSAHFPRGMRAPMLDALARAPLWAHGLDYGHGTGHGVGYFLGVHEGPQSISCHAAAEPQTAMEAGMITSIEPGIYRSGLWGIRIENLVLNRSVETTDAGEFLQFETLTLCPIDTRCIDPALLRTDEIAWLNAYHVTVRERLLPHVEGAAKDWLMLRTQAI